MKLLLKQDVPSLGKVGEVVEISDGYGRNYLLPQRLAVPNTPENRRDIESHKLEVLQREEERKRLAEHAAKELRNALLQVRVKCQSDGTLYGSVNAGVVVDVIYKTKGYRVDPKWIQLDASIKKIGDYDVGMKFPFGKEITFKLTVLPEGE